MKKFVVADLHGNGKIYDSVMNYINNYKNIMDEDVTLYILGDLIDRGQDSARMLVDVYDKVKYGDNINIEYLAGNHEFLMYDASLDMRNGYFDPWCDWFIGSNGGWYTNMGLKKIVTNLERQDIINFVSNLKIYHKCSEMINNKNIVLVHGKCPDTVLDNCEFVIRDNNKLVFETLFSRDYYFHRYIKERGNPDYFSIIGHTIVDTPTGYFYNSEENTLNIDGGAGAYAFGYTRFDHTPLVEIRNDELIILTFNNNNEIIYGNSFNGDKFSPLNDELMSLHRSLLDKYDKAKVLCKNNSNN